MAGMELRRVVGHRELRHAVAIPAVFDRGKLAGEIGFGENREFKSSHHRETTGWLKSGVKAHRTTGELVERGGDCGPT